MKLKSLTYISRNYPDIYKKHNDLFQLLYSKDIKEFTITKNVMNYLTEKDIEECFIIDIKDVNKLLNPKKRYGSWINLKKDLFEL